MNSNVCLAIEEEVILVFWRKRHSWSNGYEKEQTEMFLLV